MIEMPHAFLPALFAGTPGRRPMAADDARVSAKPPSADSDAHPSLSSIVTAEE